MLSKVNSPAYMDVSATIQNQAVQTPILEDLNPSASESVSHNAAEENAFYDADDKLSASGKAEKMEMPLEFLQQEAERIRQSNVAANKTLSILTKCMRIAMKIIQGDNVPPKDDKFLAENNPELHMRAWMMRIPKKDPKDHDSELDDENDSIEELVGDAMSGSMYSSSGSVDYDMPSIDVVV